MITPGLASSDKPFPDRHRIRARVERCLSRQRCGASGRPRRSSSDQTRFYDASQHGLRVKSRHDQEPSEKKPPTMLYSHRQIVGRMQLPPNLSARAISEFLTLDHAERRAVLTRYGVERSPSAIPLETNDEVGGHHQSDPAWLGAILRVRKPLPFHRYNHPWPEAGRRA